MKLPILRVSNPLVHKKSKAVRKVTKEIIDFLEEMADTMYAAPGIGLAAPQVGKLLRIAIIDIGKGLITIINPKIIQKSGKQTMEEGCLCLPGIVAPVERAAKVTVSAWDRKGESITVEGEGLLAQALQHEIDHLDGILFVDRVKDRSLIRHVPSKKAQEEAF